MAKQTFSWQIDLAGAAAEHKFGVRTVKLGEGYEQRQQKYLRPKLQTWDAQKTAYIEEIKAVTAFFDAHAGVRSFWWTPPGRSQLLVKVAEYKETPKGGRIWQLSWKFEEVLA